MFFGMNYIDGVWIPHRSDFKSINPATEEVISEFPQSTVKEIDAAVAAAKRAQKTWHQTSRIQRGEYFDKLCQIMKRDTPHLVKAITEETGKHENESLAEVNEAIHMAQYTFSKAKMPIGEMLPSEITEKDIYVIRKPKGVVAVISPYNFPYAIGAFWNAAPALLEGNTVVFKPSEDTPKVAQLAVAQYVEAGFPAGVINLLHGDGRTGAELVYHLDINHYCFTGSGKVGQFIRHICALQMTKTCSLEMGSKSAVIVCADADLDMAVKACIASAFKLSGQRCVSAGRILVDSKILDVFCEKFVAETRKVELGPLINAAQRDRVLDYNGEALTDSFVKVLYPITEDEPLQIHSDKGYFISPFVYTTKWQKPEGRRHLKEEVFGPSIAIIPFDTIDEAIDIYNDTEFALALSVCTNDYRIMRKVRGM